MSHRKMTVITAARQARAWATHSVSPLTFKVGRQLFRLRAGLPFVVTDQSSFIKARRDLDPCPQSPSLTLGSRLDADGVRSEDESEAIPTGLCLC